MPAPQYEQAGADIGGTGTANTIPRWTGVSTLGDSLITQTLAGAPFEATRIRVATGVDTYAWFRDSAPSGNVLFVAANAAFGAYKGLEIASAGTYFTVGNVGIGTTSPGYKLDVNGSINSQQPFYIGGGSQGFITWAGAAANTLNLMGSVGKAISLGSNGVYDRLYLDTSGNLGLSVTLSAWGSSYRAFQTLGTTLGSNSTNGTYYTQNAFFDGTNWKYVTTAAANRYQMLLGVHSWHTASSGTAGNNITFTQAMTLDASGNVYAGSGTTGMTDGFFYIAAAAGAPTGTPTAVSGRVPMYYDTTNNKFYIYNGAWKQVALT